MAETGRQPSSSGPARVYTGTPAHSRAFTTDHVNTRETVDWKSKISHLFVPALAWLQSICGNQTIAQIESFTQSTLRLEPAAFPMPLLPQTKYVPEMKLHSKEYPFPFVIPCS